MKKPAASVLAARAKKIKLVGMDVDGVLTAGEIIILESGEEIKFWNSKDRLTMALLRDKKIPLVLAWITGRRSNAVTLAGDDLGIRHVIQGCHSKKSAMQSLLKKYNLSWEEAAYIGDDLIDLPVLRSVGFSAAPHDATRDVLENVHYLSPYSGGRGVVRDVLEYILRVQKRWDIVVNSFRE